jgi:glycosyltransferase involved in cell wall biosynthesis
VIVPTVGGIAEMVTDGKNGFKIDIQELDKIEKGVEDILTNGKIYLSLSSNALEKSKLYYPKQMIEHIAKVL